MAWKKIIVGTGGSGTTRYLKTIDMTLEYANDPHFSSMNSTGTTFSNTTIGVGNVLKVYDEGGDLLTRWERDHYLGPYGGVDGYDPHNTTGEVYSNDTNLNTVLADNVSLSVSDVDRGVRSPACTVIGGLTPQVVKSVCRVVKIKT